VAQIMVSAGGLARHERDTCGDWYLDHNRECAGHPELTNRKLLAQSRHTTVKVLPKYNKRATSRSSAGGKSGAYREQKSTKCQNEQQPPCQNGSQPASQVLENIGAGEGNRTLVFSLEGCCSTIELHPLNRRSPSTPRRAASTG
jgi:hypothetical protein